MSILNECEEMEYVKMKRRELLARVSAGAAGAVLLVGVAGAAFAGDDYGTDDVDVNVEITELPETGVLSP